MTQSVAIAKRDHQVAQARIQGRTYREIEKELGISSATVNRTLKKIEIKDIIETGTAHIISLVPLAVDTQYRAASINDDNGDPTALAVKASENILKTSGIIPSNVQNQTVNTVYNIQNNVTLNPGVAKALSGLSMQDDPDVIDAETV